MPPDASESPWSLAQRLHAQGLPPAVLRERLSAQGLAPDDVDALLGALGRAGAPAVAPERLGADPGVVGGVVLVVAGAGVGFSDSGHFIGGCLLLVGLLQLAVRLTPRHPEAATPVALPPEDASPRCQVHQSFGSVGVCPRCGAFACLACAPGSGFAPDALCAACEAQPVVQAPRVTRAARLAASAIVAAGLVPLGATLVFGASLRLPPGLMALQAGVAFAPFGLLATLQALVRHPWPSVLALLLLLAVTLSQMAAAPGELPRLVVYLAPAVGLLVALDRLTTRRAALRRVGPQRPVR
jgi:hypothetical protein